MNDEALHVAVSLDGENWVPVGIAYDPPTIEANVEYTDIGLTNDLLRSFPTFKEYRFSVEAQMSSEHLNEFGRMFLW